MLETTDDLDNQKPVTMRSVAEQAGVSMATVSRVLNNSGPVDPLVADRVRAVMARLKYQPNGTARALASNKSVLLGLVIADIQNPFFIDLMRGVEEEVRRNGYLLVICNTTEDPRVEEQYIKILAAAPVAGAIIIPVRERLKALELLKARHIPVVAIDHRVQDPLVDSVRINNVLAAKEATTHLISNGYRRIAMISGPRYASTANERLAGYRQALQEAGIVPDARLEQRGLYDEETGERLTHVLLDLDPPVDALLTANNRLTIGSVRTLYARHKHIPGDIALVSFDEAGWAIPDLLSITTVIQPAFEIGRTAASRLIQRLSRPDAPAQEIVLQHQLVIRDSSRPRNLLSR